MQQYFGKNKKENTIFLNSEDLNHIKNVIRKYVKVFKYPSNL